MAITLNGTNNLLPDSMIPTGYTRPSVTEVTDPEYTRTLTLNVARETVKNATPATTMDNILDDATIGINKQITDILDAEFDATATVTAHADLVSLKTNIQEMDKASAVYTAAAVSFVATVVLYVKSV